MSALGFVFPAASIGLGSLLIKPRRGFFPTVGPSISAQITIEEIHHDELEITEHPVEQGAAIADHAFKRPAEVIIRCMWSNSPGGPGGLIGAAVGVGATLGGPIIGNVLAAGSTIRAAQSLLTGNAADQVKQIYQKLLALQVQRIPFDVSTGKRNYKNMLFRSLAIETNPKTENALSVVAVCRQVILVSVQTITVPMNTEALADPESTMPVEDVGQVSLQDAPTFVPDSSSFSGVMNDLSSSMGQVNEIFGTLPASDLSQITSSAINTLPDVVGNVQEALGDVISKLPSPSEIPLIANPQQLTVSLNGALSQAQSTISGAVNGAQNLLSEAIQRLPAVLEQAQPALTEAIKQIPGVVSNLPAAFGNLTGVLETAQTQIQDVLRQVPKVLERAPLPTGVR